MVYLNYRQNRFIGNVSADISRRLFKHYLGANYAFHISRNSAELIRNIKQGYFFIAFFQSVNKCHCRIYAPFGCSNNLIMVEPVGAYL